MDLTEQTKRVLITGGSSGLGYELSKYFASEHYELLWVSLSMEELTESSVRLKSSHPDTTIHTLTMDLSKDDGARHVYEWAEAIGSVDVLINNAGFGTYGYVNGQNIEKEIAMIQCNALSLYKLSRYFMSDMIAVDQGTIINISSNSSFHPVPRMNTYASTKAFVRHFSQGLTEEMKLMGSKVRVITVCPSAIQNTPFKDLEGMNRVKTFSGLAYTTVEEVASDTWKGFKKGKDFIVSGKKMRALYKISHLIPASIMTYLTNKETELL